MSRPKAGELDWAAVDWSLSNKELVLTLGRCETYISRQRSQYAYGTGWQRFVDFWDSVDWSLSDAEIAAQSGRSVTRVRRMRWEMRRAA